MAICVRVLFLFLLTSCTVQHSVTCIAKVIHPGNQLLSSIIEYRTGDKRYVCFGPRQAYLAKGELFMLVYNKHKPWKHKLITDAPLFLETEKTQYTEGKIVRCVSGDYSKVVFTYEVNGVSYKKLQMLEGPVDLTRRNNCLVRYSPGNPARSVIMGKKEKNAVDQPLVCTSKP